MYGRAPGMSTGLPCGQDFLDDRGAHGAAERGAGSSGRREADGLGPDCRKFGKKVVDKEIT